MINTKKLDESFDAIQQKMNKMNDDLIAKEKGTFSEIKEPKIELETSEEEDLDDDDDEESDEEIEE